MSRGPRRRSHLTKRGQGTMSRVRRSGCVKPHGAGPAGGRDREVDLLRRLAPEGLIIARQLKITRRLVERDRVAGSRKQRAAAGSADRNQSVGVQSEIVQ